MKRIAVLAFAALLVAGSFYIADTHAQASAGAGTSDFEKPIVDYDKQIKSWEREAGIEIVLVGAVIVFGALVSLFQKWTTPWAKTTTVVLGIAITVITGINSKFFSADYRTLHLAAADGRAITAQLWPMAGMLNDPHTSDEVRKTTQELYFKKLAEFPAVIARLEGTKTAANRDGGLFSLPRVYAQTQQQQSAASIPGWAQKPPSDDYSLYFVGKAVDTSLSDAKTKSLDDAYGRAMQRLKARAPNASDTDLLALIKPSAIVQDSAFAYDNNAKGFVYYTLLRLAKEIETIGVKSLSAAPNVQPTIFKHKNWRPGDIALDKNSGLWVLDTDGGVSRLTIDDQHKGRIETPFHLRGAYAGYALTANADSVFIASNSQSGCTVFRYSVPRKATSPRLMGRHERCTGIATDGTAIYLSMASPKEIRYWSNWTASDAQSWSLPDMDEPGSLFFDEIGHRLIVAGSSGKAYAISVRDGKQQLLASNLGAVTSIAVSRFHIFLASGKKVFSLARSDNRVENPPANLQLTGGHIVGVAIDATDKLWFADYDNQLVEGPFPL
jgi:hypothetical protein